jgi:hypothetical protein
MILPEILAALAVALLLSVLFAAVTPRERKRTGQFWLFLILFMATWAGGIWIRPFGPTLWGIHWLSFLLVGVLVALFLSLSRPRRGPHGRHETIDMLERMEQEEELETVTYVALGTLFWILLAFLVAAVFVRYVWP